MANLSLSVIVQFCIAIVANIAALGFLPASAAFTKPWPTLACIGFFLLNLWMLARLIHGGAPLSILAPIMAAAIPLTTVAIGILAYGESSDALRITFLVAACAFTALAAFRG